MRGSCEGGWDATGRLAQIVILRESGVSSTPQLLGSIINVSEYWIAPFRGRRRRRAWRARIHHTHLRIPAARSARVVVRILRPTKGVGNAGCPLHPQPRV